MLAAVLLLVTVGGAGRAWAQAEPAPEDYVPPKERGLPPEQRNQEPPPSRAAARAQLGPRWNLAVSPRLSLRMGDAPDGVPGVGYGAGVRLHAAIVAIGPLRFGLGVQFAYDRFSRDKPSTTFVASTTQLLSHASFAALAILDGLFGGGRVRPWVGLGGGFSVADYQDPTVDGNPPMPISIVTVVPLIQLAFGVGVRVYEGFELGLRSDVDLTFSSASAGMPARLLFQPGFASLSLDVAFRF